ncbi:MAG: hypothetical protein BGO01_09525 [Armatimonadetes bacterium 55-13]|nr:glycosyltransferase family 4 protein [Armatimonadota bacterium]ODU53676.1 MAG: hypothetical protein ABT09_01365 [bacterium SCN 57-13]OJU62647.1 MAG: hypothetical protein BGO01_09525 [Armatimonadetes bacterium 55-13]
MKEVHLINPMLHASGGSEWRTIELFNRLAERTDVTIWSYTPPDPALMGHVPVRPLDARIGAVPRRGNAVIVGSYSILEPWIRQCSCERFVVIHNVDEPNRLAHVLNVLAQHGKPTPEVVYASSRLRERAQGPKGPVHVSPIDLNRFRPRSHAERPFTVGRMSRDEEIKHHPDDPDFYRRLAAQGIHVRIMGGTFLRPELDGEENIELLAVGAESAEDFLSTLDVFYYRTHPDWFEPSARVISEAMASGVPCVAEARHGYTDYFAGGILFESGEEAEKAILELRQNSQLREKLAQESRQKAEDWFSDETVEEVLQFYMR